MGDASLIGTIVSGVLSGTAGAATTMLAFFKEMRGRIEKLERAIGNPGSAVEPRTGLYLLIAQLVDKATVFEDTQKKFRREIDGWEDEPPEWLSRALNRRVSSASIDESQFAEFEKRVDQRVKILTDRVGRLETTISRVEELVADLPDQMRHDAEKFVDAGTYETESRKRAEEIRKINENLQTANGFLRGVMAALGYLDAPATSPSSAPPPALPGRRK